MHYQSEEIQCHIKFNLRFPDINAPVYGKKQRKFTLKAKDKKKKEYIWYIYVYIYINN